MSEEARTDAVPVAEPERDWIDHVRRLKVVSGGLTGGYFYLTYHLTTAFVETLHEGHELSDAAFLGVIALVSVVAGASVKALDYFRRKDE